MSRLPDPKFCWACGTALPGPVKHCPGCGAAVVQRRRGMGPAAVAGIVVLVAGTCFVGLLVAIALPDFIHHRIRTRDVEVSSELQALVRAEYAAMERDGRFVEFPPLPAQTPGMKKATLAPADREIAARLGWTIGPATYGQFRIAVARTPSGDEAASLCVETDLDGDGRRGARFAFLPTEKGDGTLTAPPAPCTTPVPYEDKYSPGETVKLEYLDY